MKDNRSGGLKVVDLYSGIKQREENLKEGDSPPTVNLESVLIALGIDAGEN